MGSADIRNQIGHCQSLLAQAQADQQAAQLKLDAVRAFQTRHTAARQDMENDLILRRSRLNGSTIDASRVKTMQGLSSGVTAVLDTGNVHLSRMNEQALRIASVIRQLEDEVRQHWVDVGRYQSQLGSLNNQLAAALAEEAKPTKPCRTR